MKKILVKILIYLFNDFVPYMRFARKRIYLFLLKTYSKLIGEKFNFNYGILLYGINKTIFANNIDIDRNYSLEWWNKLYDRK